MSQPAEPTQNTQVGVRFRVQVSDEPEILTAVRAGGNVGWIVISERRVPNPPYLDCWIFEIEDPNAPAEAEGKLISPTFSRDYETGAVSISDYGIPE